MGFNLFGRKKKAAGTTADETRERGARPAVVAHSTEHSEGELERIGADSAEAEAPSSAAPVAGQDRPGQSAPRSAATPTSAAGTSAGGPASASPTSAASTGAGPSAAAPASVSSGGAGATANRDDSSAAPSSKEIGPDQLEEFVVDALRSVYDPEIPVNIYDLGLIYDLRIEEGGKVKIKMTLTAPACPVAGEMPGMVEMAARQVEGVTACDVELVWDPAWNPDMMSEAARLQLNI